jgi:hypothetical protein
VLLALNTVASPHEVRPGIIRVPPQPVPQFVVCRPDGDAFSCEELAASADVPVGAPFYGLRENRDWVEKAHRPEAPDVEAIVESVFGRPLSRAEERLLITFETASTSGSRPSGGGAEGETTTGG